MIRSNIAMTGLLAAVLTGTGEFMLHYDALARYGAEFEFFNGISDQRSTLGHFVAVLGAPFYVVGCWHIKKMLEPG